jgi:integrase/recombinase XerD
MGWFCSSLAGKLPMKPIVFGDRVRRRMTSNHLGIVLADFVEHLQSLGYASWTIRNYAGAVEHFGCWLKCRHLDSSRISPELVCSFLHRHLDHCHCPKPARGDLATCGSALHALLELLQRKGMIGRRPGKVASPKEQITEQFDRYLVEACGVAETTRRARRRTALELLSWRFGNRPLRLQQIAPGDLMRFVSFRARSLRPMSVRALCDSLRSFLRFLHLQGRCPKGLDLAVPTLHAWNRAKLPTVIGAEQLRRFLSSFDRSTAMGRRDYAMALCMCELGLRVNEVARLSLGDLDWRKGTLTLPQNKQRRELQLPLPSRLARAIASYLRHGRPASTCCAVFLRHRTPVGRPLHTVGIRWAIRRRYDRVGIRATGTHLLRRTFATRLHQRGVSVKLVADFLGHKDLGTAAVYARVNLEQLRQLVLPWPKASP